MNTKEQDSGEDTVRWPTATDLDLPWDLSDISEITADKIDHAYTILEAASGSKLDAYFCQMGTVEACSLLTKLYCAASVLLEQCGTRGNNREMVKKLRQLHREHPRFPSLATIYRAVAPLKIWLQERCHLAQPLSTKQLRADKRPLFFLTNEKLLDLVEECKTYRRFIEVYRAVPREKPVESEAVIAATAPAESTDSAAPETESIRAADLVFVIRGALTSAEQQWITKHLGKGAELVQLDGLGAVAARQWLDQKTVDNNRGRN
jgi:hypothetical protein